MTDAPKTVRNGDHYVVEINGEWHVLFAPRDLPRHFLSIASFADKKRAEMYSEMEEDMLGDDVRVIEESEENETAIAPNALCGQYDDVATLKLLDKPIAPGSLLAVIDQWFGRQMHFEDMQRLERARNIPKNIPDPAPAIISVPSSVDEKVIADLAPSPPWAAAPPPLPETAPEPEAPVAAPVAPAIPIQEPDIKPSEGQAPAETSAISSPPGGEAGEEARSRPAPAAITKSGLLNLGRGETLVLGALEQAHGKVVTCESLCNLTGCSKGSVEAYISNLKRRLTHHALKIDGYPTAGWRLIEAFNVTGQLMGDPSPGRSALEQRA